MSQVIFYDAFFAVVCGCCCWYLTCAKPSFSAASSSASIPEFHFRGLLWSDGAMNPLRPRTPQYTYSLSRYVARATSENLGAQWPPASSRWICHTCRGRDSVPRREARSTVSASKHRDNAFRELASCNAGRRSFLTTSSNKEQSQTGHAQSSPSSLPSQAENRRSDLSKRLTSLMDHMQSNIFIAGQRLNDLTGYSGIETLKKDIENQGRPPQFL